MQKAIFGAGCFWGVESIFRAIPGVTDVVVGYSGGKRENPTYEQVCTGATGHAEAVEVTYDETQVGYDKLLDVFWQNHNPTTPNQQGPDHGSQYRSVIMFHSEEQKSLAEASRDEAQKKWEKPIVTEIVEATPFYPAEDYHQRYFEKRGITPTCHI